LYAAAAAGGVADHIRLGVGTVDFRIWTGNEYNGLLVDGISLDALQIH